MKLPEYMTLEDVKFFLDLGWRQISMAEFRCSTYSGKTVELMTHNGGQWTARWGGWEGPKAQTPTAAYVAAELDNWGDQRPSDETPGARMRRQFKETFTG